MRQVRRETTTGPSTPEPERQQARQRGAVRLFGVRCTHPMIAREAGRTSLASGFATCKETTPAGAAPLAMEAYGRVPGVGSSANLAKQTFPDKRRVADLPTAAAPLREHCVSEPENGGWPKCS